MATETEVWEAVESARQLPYGSDRAELLEHAVDLADQLGDQHLQVDTRNQLAEAYAFGDCGPHEFTVQAWLLNALDRADPPLTSAQRRLVLWQCKWTMERALSVTSIPLDVMHRTFDDVERRYRAEGESDQPAAKFQLLLARDTADRETIEHWTTAWRTSPRSSLSDCATCDADLDARIMAEDGDVAGALARILPTVEGRRTCTEEPNTGLSRAVDWYARSGLFAEAERAHLQGWRLVQDRSDNAQNAVRHLVFLVRAGQVQRAMALLLPRISWLTEMRLDRSRMALAAAGATILRAAVSAGAAPETVDGEPVAALADRLDHDAQELATAFDARNGTDRVSRWLAESVDPTPYDLSAAPDDFLQAVAVGGRSAEPARPGDAATADEPVSASRAAGAGAGDATVTAEPTLPTDVQTYLISARAAVRDVNRDEVRRLLTGWLEARGDLPAATTTNEHAARATLDRMALQLEDLDERRQAELLADALTHAEKSGERSLMLRVRVEDERRQALAGDGEALARARDLVADLEATEDGEAVASSLLSLVSAAKDPATALDLAEAAAAAFDREGAGRWRGVALHTAGVAAGPSDRDRSVELLRAARAVAADEGFTILETACVSALARLSWQSGELDDAERLMRETVALAERGGIDATPAYADLGDVLVDAENWSALATTARDELRHAQRGDDRRAVALAQRHLGLALHETGRHAEGAEILETARPVLREHGLPAYAPTCWALGNALAALGDHLPAAAAYDDAAEAFLADDRTHEATHALLRRGGELSRSGTTTDRREAVAVLDRAAGLAREQADATLLAGVLRARADALAATDGVDAAVSALDGVPDQVRRAVDADSSAEPPDLDYLQAMTERHAALLLADAGRWDDAVERIRHARGILERQGNAAALVLLSEEGRMLGDSGRTRDGERVLREALPRLADGGFADEQRQAASSLVSALEQDDREAEAQQVWETWGETPPRT